MSLKNKKIKDPLIINLLNRLDSLSNSKEILMYWIPSHIGVKVNERADLPAKSALDLTPDKFKMSYIDLKLEIDRFIYTKW